MSWFLARVMGFLLENNVQLVPILAVCNIQSRQIMAVPDNKTTLHLQVECVTIGNNSFGDEMGAEIDDAIAKVLNDNYLGGAPSYYTVHHTAERVMLVFGLLPGQHRDALKELIAKQTDNRWQESPEIARVTGAKLAIGLPDGIASLKDRLAKAGITVNV